MITKDDFTRINNDVNGNPRYVFHFLHLISDEDRKSVEGQDDIFRGISTISLLYAIAIKKANKMLNGRKFHNKQYGGGIVIQSYNLDYEIKLINQITEKS